MGYGNGQSEHDRGRAGTVWPCVAWRGLEPLEPRLLLSASTLSTDISPVPSNGGFVGIEGLNTVLGNWNAVAPPDSPPVSPTVAPPAFGATVVAASTSVAETTATSSAGSASVTESSLSTGKRSSRVAGRHRSPIKDGTRWALVARQRGSRRGAGTTALRYPAPGASESDESSSYTPSLGRWEPDGGR